MNQELAAIFREMAILLEMAGENFKPRAYERVAYVLEGLSRAVREIYEEGGLVALEKIPGVGKGIGEKIEEYLKTGKIKEYQRLKAAMPVEIESLRKVEGLGPRTIKKLYGELGVKNLAELEKAAREGRIRELAGLGLKSEEKILKSINFLQQSAGRLLLGVALPLGRKILTALRSYPAVRRAELAGSAARMQETVGDLDFLAISHRPKEVMEFFVERPEVRAVHLKGPTKASVRLWAGIDADLRVVAPASFGAAWQYFIGDKFHNLAVREIAKRKGYKLNEYGLFQGRKLIAAEEEKEIYEKLGLDWIPPELRTNQGELEAAENHQLPKLIDYQELRGDLQVQTDWSDGESSIEVMAETAKKQGLEYIAITDHTQSLGVAGGLDEKKLLRQIRAIDRAQKKVSGIKILKGTEVDIKKDGSLDIADDVLSQLEVVGASVHSNFGLGEEEMTERIIRAMANPQVDIIFHPTGRLVSRREPYRVNMEKLIMAAQRTGTVLEINAFPERLDLKDEHIRQAKEAGVKFCIDSDAHAPGHFQFLELGIGQARRGWATKEDAVNTREWREMLRLLK